MAGRFGILARGLSTSSAARVLVQPPIQMFGMEGRYATALYSAAHKQKALPAVEKDLKDFSELLKTDTIFREFVLNPIISKSLKIEGIKSVMVKKKAHILTSNLLEILADNHRLQKVKGILSAFATIMAAERGEVICEVTIAKALDAAGTKELEASLRPFAKKGQTLQITVKVDPSIIGGMIVSIGDKYVDMSMSTKFKKYSSLIRDAA